MLALSAVIAMAADSWEQAGSLSVDGLTEASGLAVSHRHPGVFWTHNDSGNPPELFAVDRQGRQRARIRLEARAVDWEDIASFVRDGRPWLAVADTGDNFHRRDHVEILLLPEPALDAAGPLKPARSLRVRYAGARPDVEAMAVDAASGQLLLLEKTRPPARLYAIDLDGPDEQTARIVGALPASGADMAAGWFGWFAHDLPTAMDIDPQRRRIAVLDYGQLRSFAAAPGQTWGQALRTRPVGSWPIPNPADQFEAAAFDLDGRLWVTAEGRKAPLLRARE